jgi:hypothetical protein
MSTTLDRTSEFADRDVAKRTSRGTLVQILLACGVAYSVSYAFANDIVAATRYDGYSRMSQAVSELSATGAPTRTFLTAMLPIWTMLMIGFGIGVWMSADGKRALQVTGALLIAFGVTGVLWLPFPMTSREEMINGTTPANDVGHIVLAMVTVLLILLQLGFGAAAFGKWFRLYSLATAATVLVFGALTGTESPKVPKGEPTPWMGLSERINIGAWLLWLAVLAIMLLVRTRRGAANTTAVPAP